MQTVKTIFWLSLLGASACTTGRAESCGNFRDGDLDAAVNYLKDQVSDRTGACIADALDRMGESALSSDVDILLTFLDYIRPRRPGNLLYSPTSKMDALYPAEAALEERGKIVLPKLIELLGWGNPSGVARVNALRVYMVINRDDHVRAVSILVQMGKAFRDHPEISKEASANLIAAAKDAVSLCREDARDACENLVASQ